MEFIQYLIALTCILISDRGTAMVVHPLETYGSHVGNEGSVTESWCNPSLSGKWAGCCEASVTPYPPQHNQPVTVHLSVTAAVEDLWFATARGNISRVDGDWSYSFDAIICDGTMFCPIRKGETRQFEQTIPSPSKFLRKGQFTAWADILNQDDEVILSLVARNCTL